MESKDPKSLSLENLIALNDEIAALVRAGIPLELGLNNSSFGAAGELAVLTDRLAARISKGASIPEAISAERNMLPPVYRSIVETGLKAGRLPEALESLTGFSRSVLEIRRKIVLAFLYPTVVFSLAYILFLAFVIFMIPELVSTYSFLNLQSKTILSFLTMLHETVIYWSPIIPAFMILFFVCSSYASKHLHSATSVNASFFDDVIRSVSFGWMPWLKSIFSNSHRANFSELLAILVEQETPLPQAIVLAAESVDDRKLINAARLTASEIENGSTFSESLKKSQGFPSFMRWMVSMGESQGTLPSSLRQVSELYRSRAVNQADWLKLALPVFLVLIIAGGATSIYAFSVFLPLSEMLSQLGLEQF